MEEIILRGVSEESYKFKSYTWDKVFPSKGGVYLITKGHNMYIYLGITENLSNRFINHHKKECYDGRGADHIWVHFTEDAERREFIERDILFKIKFPCNEVNN